MTYWKFAAYYTYVAYFAYVTYYLILFLIPVPGFELSSDEDDVPLHPDLQAETDAVLDDMPSPVLPQLPPDQSPFEFSSFIRCSGGDTTSLLH